MTYKFLGRTGVKVSAIAYGTMSFGGDADEAGAKALFEACRAAGVNHFDCADMYGAGRAEEILGRLIKDCREEVLITSKVYFATSPDVNAMGASRRHIRYAVEASLRRLGTDRIDIYYVHRFDDRTPLEETLRALDDLVRAGKVVYLGASNFAAWQAAKALGISAREGLAPFACLQPMYNLVKRQAESEILPLALSEGLGVFPYSPLGGGLLTGKYSDGRRPGTGRLVANKIYATRYGDALNYEVAGRFAAFARERGYHPASLAVAWVASHPAVTAPLVGARDTAQLAPLLAAADIPMTPELRAEIAALSPEPAPATDRNEERTGVNYGVR
ncbi:MAG TPA: aldo/keto reductase [Candidatus Aminicenantes bacterium]|nr:aldo/keto reductase [Candidatus Aminicenantes bacterium]HRY66228.1 aldo/keto reductase [Candidatus Aminicenantes bacterium]HRZ73142.1 aldo/keto reductase [Candidatus Aminicenantes bacterium]